MIGIYDINDMLDFKTRIEIYKKVGFKELALYLDQDYMKEGENYLDIISFARKNGMEVKQVHVDYKISNLICDENSEVYFDYIKEKMRECENLKIPYMVVHASKGDNPPTISDNQILKIEKVAEQFPDVCLCFENVRSNTNLQKILSSNLQNIKMCFDLGHAHAYANEFELFDCFKDKIVCSHLHNNFGQDTHNILNCGEIDYRYFMNALKDISRSNCLECFPPRDVHLNEQQFYTFVQECFEATL